jgi:hypothetical protein
MTRKLGLLFAAALAAVTVTVAANAASPHTTTIVYDTFEAPGGYTLADYATKWANSFGLGDMDSPSDPNYNGCGRGDTRSFADGTFYIDDAPFVCGADFSVYDHLKYIATSTQTFTAPAHGSLTFASDIQAETPGTIPGYVVHGTYGPPGSYPNGAPYQATLMEGQQAAAVMNMINFTTGQLFDVFISSNYAYSLVERLPSSVANGITDESDPNWVGPSKMYTQFVDQVPITPGVAHHVAITYTRGTGNGANTVEFFVDGKRISKVNNVGIPVDRQPGQTFTGSYPSLGPGENLGSKLDAFTIGYGDFSVVDPFPFQWGWQFGPLGPTCDPLWPAVCADSVSIPLDQRLFGQGVRAHYDNFTVTTQTQ